MNKVEIDITHRNFNGHEIDKKLLMERCAVHHRLKR